MKNEASGKVFYGLHFYPGVARYEEPDSAPFQVFINENTIREMSPTLVGKPLFVQHVDEVSDNLKDLTNEADGWVTDSFFNQADGKTWCKFIVVSDKGLKAIASGYRLSNSYRPLKYGKGGMWSGMTYDKEVTAGCFDHLALVDDPRYSESVIMTPEEFKTYNEENIQQIKKLSNSKTKGKSMLNFFKREKIENSNDLETMLVELPKSKKEVSIIRLINAYEKMQNLNGFADPEHMVKMHDGAECSVAELVKKHKKAMNDIEDMKKNAEGDEGDEQQDEDVSDSDNVDNEEDFEEDAELEKEVGDRGGDVHEDKKENAEDEEEPKDDDKKKNKKKQNKLSADAKERALKLKNARGYLSETMSGPKVSFSIDAVERGKEAYGRSIKK